MPTIPNGLVPTIQGYSIGAPDGVVRTPVGGGVGRYTAQWAQGPIQVQVQMVMEAQAFSAWSVFFLHSVKKGQVSFDMPLDTGAGTETHTVNIVPGTYKAQREGGSLTRVSFTVETQSAIYGLSDSAAQAQIDAYNGYTYTGGVPAIPNNMVPIVEKYDFDGPGGSFRSEVAGGAPKYALDWDRDVQQFRVTLVLDYSRFNIWCLFFAHTIAKGAEPFTMTLDSGMGPDTHTVQIIPGTYSAVASDGPLRMVSFAVEAESSVYALSDADAQSVLDVFATYGEGSTDLLARIAQFANYDTSDLP